MTDSVFIDVPTGTWTEVLAASLTGLISNEGNKQIRVVEAAGAPADAFSKGHTINPGANITMTTAVGQEIYAQGVGDASKVVVTSA